MEEERAKNDRISSLSDCSNLDRERSTSDPCIRKGNLVMNGNVALRHGEKNGLVSSTIERDAVGTPQPVRKNKFAASIGKLLRPWKWRKRKKSDRFIATSQSEFGDYSLNGYFVICTWYNVISVNFFSQNKLKS